MVEQVICHQPAVDGKLRECKAVFACRFADVTSPKQDSQSADLKTCGRSCCSSPEGE